MPINTAVGASTLVAVTLAGSSNTAVGAGAGPNVVQRASITLTSANSLVTTMGPPSTTKTLRSASPTSRLGMGSGPQPATSVVSGTTPSLLATTLL